MDTYDCTSEYWDTVAKRERDRVPGVSEHYTQRQCLKAFSLGLDYLKDTKVITMLKTDLWTEGIVRSREVLAHAVHLAEKRGFLVNAYGQDISLEICHMAIEHGTPAIIEQGDIRQIHAPNGFFNLILDVSTIDHLPFSQAIDAFREYTRCLRAGGILVLMFAHDRDAISKTNDHRQDYFPFSISDVREQLEDFDIKREHAIHFLNILPAGILLDIGKRYHIGSLVTKAFSIFEYTPLSRFMKGIAPMYLMIGVRK